MKKGKIDRAHYYITQRLDELAQIGEQLAKQAIVDPENDSGPKFHGTIAQLRGQFAELCGRAARPE